MNACEAGGQLNQHQQGAALKGPLTEAREAGGQRDRRHLGAVSEGAHTNSSNHSPRRWMTWPSPGTTDNVSSNGTALGCAKALRIL